MDFGDVEHTLSEKKGPLPIWGYGVFIAVGMIYFMHRSSTAASTAASATNDASSIASTDSTTDGSDVYSTDETAGVLAGYLANDPTNTAQNVGIGSSGLPSPVTNAQWARVVADYLNGLGDDPTLVANALSKFLSGTSLSTQEDSIVNEALTYAGTPPEGVIPVNVTPTPTTPTTTNPKGVTGVTGGFTGGQGDHVTTDTTWGSPTTTHASPGAGWGSTSR